MRVPISAKLMNDIDRQIAAMRAKELQQLVPTIEIMDDDSGEWFIKWMWGEHLHLKAELPNSWKEDAIDSAIIVVDVPYCDNDEQKFNSFTIRYNLLGDWSASMPPDYVPYKHQVYDELPEPFKPAVGIAIEKLTVDRRWGAVSAQVRDFLRGCPSLNKALELWPDFRVYVPDSYLDIVAQPNPKRAKRAKRDLSAATSALAALDKGTLMAAKVRERLQKAEDIREAAAEAQF